jgi:hypothetical protein
LNSRTLTIQVVLTILLLSSLAASQTLTGTVKNVTTGKPSAGDEVVLIKLGQGMEEAGHTKTDSKGNFSFKLDDAQSPHLVRAIHQDVTYHRMAPQGTTSVEVEVYDVGKKIDGIEVIADIMRVQGGQGQLEIMRAFAVQNSSKPPRTQMNDRNLEFYLPKGAQIVEGSATTEHGNPLKSLPVQAGENNRYSFMFPLRPGITQFKVTYQLPYSGSANIDPQSLYPLQHFVAIVPKAMEFAAAPGASFKPMNDPNQPDANVQLASSTTEGQTLAFKVSGEGLLQARVEGNAQGEPASSIQSDNRPGGGLGPPSHAPDPLERYRWYILGSFAVVLVVGAVYVVYQRKSAANATAVANSKARSISLLVEDEQYESNEASGQRETAVRQTSPQMSAKISSSSLLLDVMKEELFQLEIEHKGGDISQQEYDRAKSALDQTLERALKRKAAQGV